MNPEAEEAIKPVNFEEECFPIPSLDAINEVIDHPPSWTQRILPLQQRSPTVVENTLSDCHSELSKFSAKPRLDRRFVPKTLICHDYKGGYLDDKFLTGVPKGNLYTFYNWAHIDTFVYFSHKLVTIPPLAWINAAHKNGVKILGTLITEFGPGTKICEKIFKDEETMRIFATSLVKIATIFQFDGWLLNIENGLPGTDMLKKFVSYFTTITHQANPENLVIWFDSVVDSGELRWQNELNSLNKFFFDNCDGIFLNYVWNEENIKTTLEYARHRPLDVYVGMDVFGRNSFGGGQFNTYKAAQVVRKYHLSIAIFAPGWTHETLPDQHRDFESFINRDSAFWSSLWPYLYTHPITDFFKTTFFLGTNQGVFDLYQQERQLSKIKHPNNIEMVPNFSDIPNLANKCKCLQCSFTKNGVNLLISKHGLSQDIPYIHRLFTCDIFISGTISIYYITQQLHEAAVLSLTLITIDQNHAIRELRCRAIHKQHLINNSSLLEINCTTNPLLTEHAKLVFANLIAKSLTDNLKITAFQFEVATPCTLLEIGCILQEGSAIKLLAFGIEQNLPF